MSKVDFFKPGVIAGFLYRFEDGYMTDAEETEKQILEYINGELNNALGPEVFCFSKDGTTWTDYQWRNDRFKARLFNIQTIEREKPKCDHSNVDIFVTHAKDCVVWYKCRKCGVDLKATFEEVKE